MLDDFQEALLSSDEEKARMLLYHAGKNHTALELVETIIVPALDSIGKGWEENEFALSQVYMSGRICENIVDAILPAHSKLKKTQPKIAVTVLNDYHVLGKRIVCSVLRAGGYDLQDYGRMEAEELVRRVRNDRIELLMISVLMLSSALRVKDVVRYARHYGCNVKIAVGGAPFRLGSSTLWQEVGADMVGRTASDALSIAKSFTGGSG